MSTPALTPMGLETDGLALLPRTAPAFEAALDASRDPFADALLPFAVLIANTTDRDVIAYSVRWLLRNPAGKPIFHEVTPFQFRSLNPGEVLPAHSSRIVSLMQGLGAASLAPTPEHRQRVQMLVTFYQAQPSITVALEAAVFADGLAVGDDRNQWIPRWQGYLDADRNLALALTADAPPANVEQYLTGLRDAACAQSEPPIEPDNLAGYANRAQGYEECYTLWKGYFAHRLLASISARGEAEALAALRAAPYWRAYPRIHR